MGGWCLIAYQPCCCSWWLSLVGAGCAVALHSSGVVRSWSTAYALVDFTIHMHTSCTDVHQGLTNESTTPTSPHSQHTLPCNRPRQQACFDSQQRAPTQVQAVLPFLHFKRQLVPCMHPFPGHRTYPGAYLPKYLAKHGSLQPGTASSLAFHLGNMLSGGGETALQGREQQQ